MNDPDSNEHLAHDNLERASRGRQSGPLGEFWLLLKENKKWWLAPIALLVLLLGVLVALGGSAAAPFIYTLF